MPLLHQHWLSIPRARSKLYLPFPLTLFPPLTPSTARNNTNLRILSVNGTFVTGPTTIDPNNVWECTNTTLTPACCATVLVCPPSSSSLPDSNEEQFVQKRTDVIEVREIVEKQKQQSGPCPPFNPWYCQPPEVTVTTTTSTSTTTWPTVSPQSTIVDKLRQIRMNCRSFFSIDFTLTLTFLLIDYSEKVFSFFARS